MKDLELELARTRERVEQALDAALPEETRWPETLHRAMRYSVFAGGKRIRPLLALAAGQLGPPSETASLSPRSLAMRFACAVELVHTFSLIHDDLPAMDDDDLRRGKPTSHKVFGEAVAILAGDALLARAFELLCQLEGRDRELLARQARAASLLAEACFSSGLTGGQAADIESEGRPVSPEDLERIHRAKTGALLRASVLGGAVIAGATPPDELALDRFASALGLAFQVVDDVLDATETSEALGKTAGKDHAARKATYVRVHGLEAARARARELLDEALSALAPLAGRAARLEHLARRIVERRS